MADLVVLTGNCHNNRAAVDWLRVRSRADQPGHYDIGFVSEAQNRRRQLRNFPGHDYYTGPTTGPAQEVGILLNRRMPILGESSQLASEAIAGKLERVGKERWGKTVVTEVNDTIVAAITVHPVAGEELRTGHLPNDHILVKRYADAMNWLDATLTAHRNQGHQIVLGGDLQVVPTNQKPWSVYPLLAAHRLEVFRDGIDLIAWTNGFALIDGDIYHQFPSDGHPALRVQLDLATKRKKQP